MLEAFGNALEKQYLVHGIKFVSFLEYGCKLYLFLKISLFYILLIYILMRQNFITHILLCFRCLQNPLESILSALTAKFRQLQLHLLQLSAFEWEKLAKLQRIFGIFQPIHQSLAPSVPEKVSAIEPKTLESNDSPLWTRSVSPFPPPLPKSTQSSLYEDLLEAPKPLMKQK